MPYEVRAELKPTFVDTPFLVEDNTRKWAKLDENTVDHVLSGIVVGQLLYIHI